MLSSKNAHPLSVHVVRLMDRNSLLRMGARSRLAGLISGVYHRTGNGRDLVLPESKGCAIMPG